MNLTWPSNLARTPRAVSSQELAVTGARQAIVQLLNLVGALATDSRELGDEINWLKGEQGKPSIKPNRPASPPTATNHASERERSYADKQGKYPGQHQTASA